MNQRSGEDKSQNQSVNQNFIDSKLLERVETTREYKAAEFNHLKQQSFILQNPLSRQEKRAAGSSFQSEQDLDNLMNRIDRYKQEKVEADSLTWRDSGYWKYIIKNNVDLFSLLLLESTLMIGVYPLLTLKTRLQAKHKSEDVCFFHKNQAKNTPVYYGISQAMAGLFVGSVISHSTFRLVQAELFDNPSTKDWGAATRNTISFLAGDIVSIPFRLPFEVRRMLIQMNVQEISHDSYFRAVRKSFAPMVVRDTIFRTSFNVFYNLGVYFDQYKEIFFSDNKEKIKYTQAAVDRKSVPVSYQRQTNCMMLATAAAIIVSNPFDVIVTRLSCQQYNKYTGFANCFSTILKEEGPQKLFLSGFGFRFAYYLLNASMMLNGYETFRDMIKEAYE